MIIFILPKVIVSDVMTSSPLKSWWLGYNFWNRVLDCLFFISSSSSSIWFFWFCFT